MLKICTVYFGDLYTPDYVGKLFDSIRRNSSIPFQSVCISDDPNVEADIVLPYNHASNVKKHWHKLKFFSPNFAYQNPGDDIIVMDIDQVITNNVDDLIGYPVHDNELVTYGIWWKSLLETNGGFYKFKSGSLKFVWDDFIENPEYWQMHYYINGDVHFKYYGEQNYVNWKTQEYKAKIIKTPAEWIGKYHTNIRDNVELNKIYCNKFDTDYMILDEVNENIKVVHFTGPGKTIHEHDAQWIKEHWNKKEFKQQLKNNKLWFCPLPFTHIFSSLSGRYAPCYDALGHTGHNMEDTTIEEWYTSDYQNKLRDQMTREDYDPKYLDIHCTGCRLQEKKYGRSDRMKYVEQVLAGTFDSKVPELLRTVQKFKQEHKIGLDERLLDIKMKMFGNGCNLDCYMCTPRSANTRTLSLKKIGKVYDPDLDPKDGERMNTLKHDDERYLDDVASVAKYTRSIKLIGGEPLVMKNHYKLLDKLVKTGYSKDIDLIYKTNLSVFDMEGYNFRDYFDHFKEFIMKISIDSYGKYNDYIRKKSDWPDLINNMEVMRARKNSRVNVHSVISFLSVLQNYKLIDYLKEVDIPHTFYIIEYPAILQVKNLPRKIKDDLIPKYKEYPNIVKALEKEQDVDQFIKSIEYCIALDKLHGHNLFELHPELKSYYKKAKNNIIEVEEI